MEGRGLRVLALECLGGGTQATPRLKFHDQEQGVGEYDNAACAGNQAE